VATLKTLDRSEVTRLQEALRASGQRAVAADGELGPQTEVALRRFQEQHGLSQTGEPDEATLEALGLGAEPQPTGEALTTWAVAAELLATHPEYAGGVPRDFELSPPDGSEQRAKSEWVDEVRTLYVVKKDEQLDDRKVLFGLVLLDRDLRGALGRPFVDALAHEITDLAGRLSGRGKALHVPDAVPTLSDQPAEVDLLGRRAFAEALVSRIRDERGRSLAHNALRPRERLDEDPDPDSFMLHLEGPWGSGKTSLLGFMRNELRSGDEPWIVVDFNAWQHQRVGEPLWFMIRDVYRTALAEAGWQGRLRLRWDSFVWRVWVGRWRILGFLLSTAALVGIVLWAWNTTRGEDHSIALAGVIASAVTTAVGGAAALRGLVSSTGSARGAESFRQHTANPMRTLQRRWREIVADAGSPVAIFIDDLDRCRPEYVVEVLEGIQTLLRDAPVTFVVAADRRWLYDSYAAVYSAAAGSSQDAGRPLGHLFLEKTFQLSTSVPRLSIAEQSDYWKSLILPADERSEVQPGRIEKLEREFKALHTEEDVFAHLDRHADEPQVVRRAARAAAVRQLSTPELERHTEHTLIRFAPLLESNPRAMKRLVNAYGVERAHQVIGGHSTELSYPRERLALWTILKARWPLLAEYLGDRPEAIDALKQGQLPEDVVGDTERPYLAKLFADRSVRRVVDGSVVGVDLDRASLELLLEGPAADAVRHS
jgi:hypothetical protein